MALLKITASLENYLETIYHLIEDKKVAKAIDISKRMGVGKSSVTEALKSLAKRKLINHDPYSDVTLTSEGESVAREIVIKHEILYSFLSEVLGIEREEAKNNACKIEHVISENVLGRLVTFIEFSKEFCCKNHNMIEEFEKFSNKKLE